MSEKVKIFTVCLTSYKKFKATAVFDGETLVVASVQPINGFFSSWRDPLIKEVQERVAQGYIVLVEEKTDYVARHATQYLLEDLTDDDGQKRSNYFDALDWYCALADTNNLVLHPDYQQFNINASGEGGMFDRQQDDKGRSRYVVDWKRFHGGYRAVLLCVVAAMYEPISERFLQSMFEADELAHQIANPALNFKALIQRTTLERGREFERQKDEHPINK